VKRQAGYRLVSPDVFLCLCCACLGSSPMGVGSTDLDPDDGVRCASRQAQFGEDIEHNGSWSPIGGLVEVDADDIAVDKDVNVHIVGVTSRNARRVVDGDLTTGRRDSVGPVPTRGASGWRLAGRGRRQRALQSASPVAVGTTHLNPFNNITSGIGGSGPVGVQSVIESVSAISGEVTEIVVEVQGGFSAVGLFDADVAIVALTSR